MTKDATQVTESTVLPPETVKLLTLNTWGLKWVSRLRSPRLRAIADRLGNPSQYGDYYDIVALQEVWVQLDWDYLDTACRDIYPYRRHFKSGILTGPGLAIMSKIPILETMLHRFPVNGRASAFWRGDFYVGKSVAVCLLKPQRSDARPIAVLNAHMHAPYELEGDANYACHRACQAWEMAHMQKILRKAGYAVIQVGDLNSVPGSLPFRLFTDIGGLSDTWDCVSGQKQFSIADIGKMTSHDQIVHAGTTCDSQLCTWRAHLRIDQACRLDYALVDPDRFTVVDAKVKFTERLPEPYLCSYSDHFAYYVELAVHSIDHSESVPDSANNGAAINAHQELLAEISQYCTHTLPMQSLWRIWHFYISIIVVVGLLVASPFLNWPQPAMIVLCLVIGITGLLNGMICFFGVRVEKRALEEVVLQVENSFESIKSA